MIELAEFLRQMHEDVSNELSERTVSGPSGSHVFSESVFAEIVMRHMVDVGMTLEDPIVCHLERTVRNTNLRMSGYALSEELQRLDLFVCLYEGTDEITVVTDTETRQAAIRGLNLLARCMDGKLAASLDTADEAYPFVMQVQESFKSLDEIRIFVLTDRKAKSKQFPSRTIAGKTVAMEVMDIERLYRHLSEGKARDELTMNLVEICGSAQPCVRFRAEGSQYDYVLTALPGEALRSIYETYGPRLLEANVRSFLSVTGKVNKGIRDTLVKEPERFIAFNNGIVLVADEAEFGTAHDGSPGLVSLKGMQIVNGGQTTASIYFASKKSAGINLGLVRIATKIILLRDVDEVTEDALVADISRFSNSQNAVKSSDLSANRPLQIALERLSETVYCPDGVSRWFYERAAGSYQVMLAREGTTPARLRKLRQAIPPARRITKTDFAKYMNAWAQKPHIVSLGAQKNFDRYMSEMMAGDPPALPDVATYKLMIARVIVYKKAQNVVRPMFKAFQGNVVAYLIAVLASEMDGRIDLQQVWDRQNISPELGKQLQTWAVEVNEVLVDSARGRMLSEWAKKEECWQIVRSAGYSPPARFPERTS